MIAWKTIYFNRDDFLLYTLAPLGIALLCMLVNLVVVGVFHAGSTFVFLPVLLLIAAGILGMVASVSALGFTFVQMVRLSVSRRRALLGVLGYLAAVWAVLAGLCTLLTLADRFLVYRLFPRIFPWVEVLGDPLYEVGVGWLPLAAAVGVWLGVLIGVATLIFGRRGSFFLWLAYFAIFLLRELIPWDFLLQQLPLFLAVSLLLTLAALWRLLRLPIRDT